MDETRVTLTKPFTLEGESDDVHHDAPNLIRRILSLFKNIRPGSDLTRFQLPPVFNAPKSHLQCYGEQVYCVGTDMLSRCSNGETPLERLTSVVAFSISTVRPLPIGVAPYNPILGETHHVSSGNLNILLEQVSHHPPISALHATDAKANVEMIWCHRVAPKFHGASVEGEVQGKRQVRLLKHAETYVMNSPNLQIRFLPVQSVDWVGEVRIRCQETGLEAELCYKGTSFLGRNGRSIKGKIFDNFSSKTLYEIDGHWDRTVSLKEINSRKLTVVYNAKEVISGLKTPTVEDSSGVVASESAVVWSEVSKGIISKDWEKAREAKRVVEENQRKILKEREKSGETWAPNHFTISYTKEGGWDCSPIQKWVPPGPIVVPP